MDVIIDEKVNELNKEMFEKYGTQRPNKKRHRCCVCKEPVSISGSFSNNGDRLICSICAYKIFSGNVYSLMKWINRENKDEV